MAEKPYTDDDVKLVVRALVDAEDAPRWVPDDADPDEAERGHYAHAVLAALAVDGRLTTSGRCGNLAPIISLLFNPVRVTCALTAGHTGWHRGDDGSEWFEHGEPVDADVVQRMLDDATRAFADAGTSSERVEVIRDLLAGWYAAWPATAVTDEHEGIAHQLAALVYAAEARVAACPCLPGAPEHRHGVGGYSTSGERAAETHHVIAFAGDGTWSLEHPATCRAENDAADGADWDCPVRKLAERGVAGQMAGPLASGRYECWANHLGDVFLLGDRIDPVEG